MKVVLLHKFYNPEHLMEVKEQMLKLGPPTIRALWSKKLDVWLAVEGCHRLRAAKELGFTPTIKPVMQQKTVTTWLFRRVYKASPQKLTEILERLSTESETIDFWVLAIKE